MSKLPDLCGKVEPEHADERREGVRVLLDERLALPRGELDPLARLARPGVAGSNCDGSNDKSYVCVGLCMVGPGE